MVLYNHIYKFRIGYFTMAEYLFGKKIKYLRLNLGITQAQLADAMHTSRSTISAYETGYHKDPPRDNVNRIARFFNVSVNYLIDDSIPITSSVDTSGLPFQDVVMLNEMADEMREFRQGLKKRMEEYKQRLSDPSAPVIYQPAEDKEETSKSDTEETGEDELGDDS